jgi:hypothetical protein
MDRMDGKDKKWNASCFVFVTAKARRLVQGHETGNEKWVVQLSLNHFRSCHVVLGDDVKVEPSTNSSCTILLICSMNERTEDYAQQVICSLMIIQI